MAETTTESGETGPLTEAEAPPAGAPESVAPAFETEPESEQQEALLNELVR